MTFEEIINRAISRTLADGVIGWGMVNPIPHLLRSVVMSPPFRKMLDRYQSSGDASMIKLIPITGQLFCIGRFSENISFWVHIGDNEFTYLKKEDSERYHTTIKTINPERIPEFLLVQWLDVFAYAVVMFRKE